MKLIVTLAVSLSLAAGAAAAQGTFNNGKKPATGFGTPSYGAGAPAASPYRPRYGQPPSAANPPRTYGAPDAGGGFKPYEPYKPGSTYASPKRPSYGAKPCETSVYTNACEKGR